MARYIYINFLMLFVFITPALAGFEWVPPAEKPALIAPQIIPQNVAKPMMDRLPAVPAPVVSRLPIPLVPELMPAQNDIAMQPSVRTTPRSPVVQNVSGKKLVINPYPLQQGNEAPQQRSMKQSYKALSESAGLLNPVQLGSGLSTGVRKRSVSHPVSMASVSRNTSMGMTPMIGGEPAPLLRGDVQQIPLNNNYAEAVGFGRDLPLALALSQIIPSDYTHNFSQEVDAGISVSWEGGKSWDQVLDDMLKPKNLMAVIRDNRVIIQPLAHI